MGDYSPPGSASATSLRSPTGETLYWDADTNSWTTAAGLHAASGGFTAASDASLGVTGTASFGGGVTKISAAGHLVDTSDNAVMKPTGRQLLAANGTSVVLDWSSGKIVGDGTGLTGLLTLGTTPTTALPGSTVLPVNTTSTTGQFFSAYSASTGAFTKTAVTVPTTGTSTAIQKGDGIGGFAPTTPGIDYALPPVVQTVGNADATISATTDIVRITAALTAARTYTLPAATSKLAIRFEDEGGYTASFAASVIRAGTDTVNGGTTAVAVLQGYGHTTVVSDLASKWGTPTFTGTGAVVRAGGDIGAATGTSLTLAGSTVTTSQPPISATQTWNASGVAFTGLKLNITDTASAVGSLLMDLQVGSTSKFFVDKAGMVKAGGFTTLIPGTNTTLGIGSSGIRPEVNFVNGFAGDINFFSSSSPGGSAYFQTGQFNVIKFTSNGDASLSRISAGLVGVGNGTVGDTSGGTKASLHILGQRASAPSALTDAAQLYSLDVSGTAEMFVKDEAGNQTQISPHALDALAPASLDAGASAALPVVIHHRNDYLGTEEWIHLSAMAREVEKLTGKTFVFSRPLPASEKRDWDTDQEIRRAERAAQIDAWQTARDARAAELVAWKALPAKQQRDTPKPADFTDPRPADYVKKPKPARLKN